MRLASILCLTLLSACDAQVAEPQRDFSERMLPSLKAHMPDRKLKISADDPLAIEVVASGDHRDDVINLHRIYGYCEQASAEDCEAIKAEFVAKLVTAPPPPTRKGLRVIVRDQQYVDYVVAQLPAENRPKFKPIGEGLYRMLAFDEANTVQLANADTLKQVGLDEAQAWTLAWSQTRAILPEIPAAELKAGKPVAFQDFPLAASLLADTETWTAIAREAPPDMFATVVADDFVFVAFRPSGPRLDAFAETVREDCQARPRCISPYIYRFNNGRWEIAE